MPLIKLNDGTEISKMVAERIYTSIRRSFDNPVTRPHLMHVLKAFTYAQQDYDGQIFGYVDINETSYQGAEDVLSFYELEREGLISNFDTVKYVRIASGIRGEFDQRYSFTIPQDAEAMFRNTVIQKADAIRLEKPTHVERFGELKAKPQYEYSR